MLILLKYVSLVSISSSKGYKSSYGDYASLSNRPTSLEGCIAKLCIIVLNILKKLHLMIISCRLLTSLIVVDIVLIIHYLHLLIML